jgi:tRNA pseudouridine synthase 10
METIIIEKAIEILEITNSNLCNHCLGRNFSQLIDAPDNKHRGEYIKKILIKKKYNFNNVDSCYLCNNLFEYLETKVIKDIINKITRLKLNYSTFLVGCRIKPEILKKEEIIQQNTGKNVENIKKELNREIGKKLSLLLNKEVDFEHPDIVIVVDLIKDDIQIQINPIFIEGRYKKFFRGIPQTKWFCRSCKGKGCRICNFTGKMYQESVEELISEVLIKILGGTGAKFHGAGREDLDVRMLGNGRPFVIEIKEPKVRTYDLKILENRINRCSNGKIEVINLNFVEKDRIKTIKNSSRSNYKIYRAIIKIEDDISEENLKLLKSLKMISQRTPLRVSHRRADIIRKREITYIKTNKIDSKKIEMIIQCEGGLYIKELINGDQNRTSPNISEVLKTSAYCINLDVLNVKF